MKQGIKTTEFWLTVLGMIGGILVATGVLTEGESEQWVQAIGAVVALILPVFYGRGRVAVKVANAGNDG